MKDRRRRSLGFDAMESRVLLSALSVPTARTHAFVASRSGRGTGASRSLGGGGQGDWHMASILGSYPSPNIVYSIGGTGNIGSLGQVQVSGEIVCFPELGLPSQGKLSLRGRRVNVELKLTGPYWEGLSSDGATEAPRMAYTVSRGAGWIGMRGTLDVTLVRHDTSEAEGQLSTENFDHYYGGPLSFQLNPSVNPPRTRR